MIDDYPGLVDGLPAHRTIEATKFSISFRKNRKFDLSADNHNDSDCYRSPDYSGDTKSRSLILPEVH